MKVTFITVEAKYQHLFTVGKDYPIDLTHKLYGYHIFTDNAKES